MLTEDWDATLLLTAFQPADILFALCGWGRAACSLGSAEGDWCVLALHLSLLSPQLGRQVHRIDSGHFYAALTILV